MRSRTPLAFLAVAMSVTSIAGRQVPVGPTMARANFYDDAWESAWVNHGRALLSGPGKTAGFVLQIGDSITHSRAYSAWAIDGQGHTADDAAVISWARASVWSGTETDTTNKNGFYLTGADTTPQRGMTSSSDLATAELVTGCCNNGPPMPSVVVPATARGVIADTSYAGNIHIDTLIAAFGDAQFAVVMLGTNAPGSANNLADLSSIVAKLEAASILPILSTIPPRNDAFPNQLNIDFNTGVRALARAHSLPLVDFYEEIVLRRPNNTWINTLISSDGVHPTGDRAGFTVESNPYQSGGDPATHTTGSAAANVGYLLRSWLTVQKLKEVKRYVVDGIDPGTNAVQNAQFSAGATSWQTFATPDSSFLVSNVTNGVLQFYRNLPPPGTTNQAVVFQTTGVPLPANAPVLASFSLGNSSTVRKRISVLLHDSNFSDLSVCTFWLAAGAPLRTYGFATHTTQAWTNATVSFYAATAGSDGGFYRIDNVIVQQEPAVSTTDTACLDPAAPTRTAEADGPPLLANGDFGTGAIAPWSVFGAITSRIAGGVFEFFRPPGSPAGVVLQSTAQPIATNSVLTSHLQLGNSSAIRKRVTVILHDNDFSDLAACTFWLAPAQPLASYTMRLFTTKAWTNATLSVYPSTIGPEQWVRLDNATLGRTASAAISGTECAESDLGSDQSAGSAGPVELVARLAEPTRPALGWSPEAGNAASVGAPRDRWLADGFAASSQRASNAAWTAVADDTRTCTLTRAEPFDLTTAAGVRLTFHSRLTSAESRAEVQVSVGGSAWATMRAIPTSGTWERVEIDLSPYAGEVVFVRLAFDAVAPIPPAAPDTWHLALGDVK